MPVSIGAPKTKPKPTLTAKTKAKAPEKDSAEVGTLTPSGKEKPTQTPTNSRGVDNDLIKGEDWKQMEDAPRDGTPIHVCVRMPQSGVHYYDVQWIQPPKFDEPGWFVMGRQWLRLADHLMLGHRDALGVPPWTSGK